MFNVCIPNVGKERYTDIIWKVFQHFWQFKLIDHILQTIYVFLTSVSLDILLKMYIIIMSLIYNAAVPKMLQFFVKITISKGWEKEKIKSCVLI